MCVFVCRSRNIFFGDWEQRHTKLCVTTYYKLTMVPTRNRCHDPQVIIVQPPTNLTEMRVHDDISITNMIIYTRESAQTQSTLLHLDHLQPLLQQQQLQQQRLLQMGHQQQVHLQLQHQKQQQHIEPAEFLYSDISSCDNKVEAATAVSDDHDIVVVISDDDYDGDNHCC